MNWREATDVELNIVLYHDPFSKIEDLEGAKQEALRRKRKRHNRKQYKLKPVYPR